MYRLIVDGDFVSQTPLIYQSVEKAIAAELQLYSFKYSATLVIQVVDQAEKTIAMADGNWYDAETDSDFSNWHCPLGG
jgi:hypothetical protein